MVLAEGLGMVVTVLARTKSAGDWLGQGPQLLVTWTFVKLLQCSHHMAAGFSQSKRCEGKGKCKLQGVLVLVFNILFI